jgi:hypothetical protein
MHPTEEADYEVSLCQLCNDDLAGFGLPTGSTLAIIHTQSIPYGALACVRSDASEFIGEYLPQPCGGVYIRTNKLIKINPLTFSVLGVAVPYRSELDSQPTNGYHK